MFKRMRAMASTTGGELRRVMALMGDRKWPFVLSSSVGAIVAVVCFNSVLAFLIKDALDAAVLGEQALLKRALWLAIGTLLAGLPVTIGCALAGMRISIRTITELRAQLFDHIQALPVSRVERHHSGDLVSRCTNDLRTMGEIYTQSWTRIFSVAIGLIAMAAIFLLDWRIGLLVLSIEIATTALNARFAGPLREAGDTIQKRMGHLTERLSDLLAGLQVTKMFHLEDAIHRRYAQENAALAAATMSQARIDALYQASDALLDRLKKIGMLALGLFLVMRGQTAVGTIVAIIHLHGNASFMFGNIARFFNEIQRSLAGASRVFALLDSPAEPERHTLLDQDQASLAVRTNATVEVQDLFFSYDTDREDSCPQEGHAQTRDAILQGIDLAVAQGQVAALVGPSGAGKSTLLKLLMGFYPPGKGAISIDGKAIDAYTLAQLRDKSAYVSQDAYLFDGTIEENIRYGRPDATPEEVIAAAKAANAHPFIVAQADGYATVVGERGARLSGGQRQRIAIARALLKDAPILLLDEATSALDSESEQVVQDALDVLMRGRTTIAVAHRLSTIENADTIAVLDGGRILEQGTHDELIARGGVYAKLHAAQFKQESVYTFCPTLNLSFA